MFTTNDILHELHSPTNYVRVEWCSPETVSSDDRDRIKEEAEAFRNRSTVTQIEKLLNTLPA